MRQSYKEANKLFFVEVILFEDIILDNHQVKKLVLEAHEPHHIAEQLYYELKKIKPFYEKVNAKSNQYKDVELFVNDILANKEKREELKSLGSLLHKKDLSEEMDVEEESSIYVMRHDFLQ